MYPDEKPQGTDVVDPDTRWLQKASLDHSHHQQVLRIGSNPAPVHFLWKLLNKAW